MQVNLNSSIYKISNPNFQVPKHTSLVITKPEEVSLSPIAFMGNSVVTKTVTSQIAQEKSKLLRHLKDILAMDVPILSEQEKVFAQLQRALSIMKMKERREDEIEREMQALIDCNFLNYQQKIDRASQLKREFDRLMKMKITEPPQKQPSKDNFDFALINKFKSAVLSDNFDLEKIQEEHYRELANIETEEELRKKFPSLRVPQNPKQVIINKIMETLNQKFYMDLDEIVERNDPDSATMFMVRYFDLYFNELSKQFKDKTPEVLMEQIGVDAVRAILEKYEQLKVTETLDSIPKTRKNYIPRLSELDKDLLDMNFDAFLTSTMKKLYLEGEKLNRIEYLEGDKKILISAIKEFEYRFEKVPEKLKSLFATAQKIAKLQRDYPRFTSNELQNRLSFYLGTEIGNNDNLLNLIIDFDTCKFTEEDKQYLIKFLGVLDGIVDKKYSTEEAVNIINENNIHPHGTAKLDEMERQQFEEKIKQERIRLNSFNQLREDFDDAISLLYEKNLHSIAERFSKYYPETNDEQSIESTKKALAIINKYLYLKDSNAIKNAILREEIFQEYAESHPDSDSFQKSLKYASNFAVDELEQKSGQYLLNREIIENYPASSNMVANPKLLARIMERFGGDKELATTYLCKYEDYSLLNKEERSSILNILKIFDLKNSNDKIILKNIIEKDYINSDTTIVINESSQPLEVTITSKAKKALFDKYMFPSCLEYFVAFEEAMLLKASETGSSGIKKIGSNNSALDYKIELKIMGYPDRLFSSKNDYRFDVYSEKGLH